MAKELKFSYDKEGDVLDVSLGDPVAAISQEVENDFFIRLSPVTKEVVGFSMINFEKWFTSKSDTKTVPITAHLELIAK